MNLLLITLKQDTQHCTYIQVSLIGLNTCWIDSWPRIERKTFFSTISNFNDWTQSYLLYYSYAVHFIHYILCDGLALWMFSSFSFQLLIISYIIAKNNFNLTECECNTQYSFWQQNAKIGCNSFLLHIRNEPQNKIGKNVFTAWCQINADFSSEKEYQGTCLASNAYMYLTLIGHIHTTYFVIKYRFWKIQCIFLQTLPLSGALDIHIRTNSWFMLKQHGNNEVYNF